MECGVILIKSPARVAELADALASGASDRKIVGVQVPPRAQTGRPRESGAFSLVDVCVGLRGKKGDADVLWVLDRTTTCSMASSAAQLRGVRCIYGQ